MAKAKATAAMHSMSPHGKAIRKVRIIYIYTHTHIYMCVCIYI